MWWPLSVLQWLLQLVLQQRRRRRLWFLLLLASVLILSRQLLLRSAVPLHSLKEQDFLVYSPTCRIPAMDPWDPLLALLMALDGNKTLDCSAGRPRPLVASEDDGRLRLLLDALPDYNVTDASLLRCCYTPLHRPKWPKGKLPSNADSIVRFVKQCTPIPDGKGTLVVGHEFVRVDCFMQARRIFRDFHAFPLPKLDVEERCRKAVRGRRERKQHMLSVLMVGLDTVSRLDFHRKMPLTLNLLKQLGAVQMLGYNKIGDNTLPNLVGILSGLTLDELRVKCWRNDNMFFDGCPFVWQRFANAGFRTAFAEDAYKVSSFNHERQGFARQPTDFYLRPLIMSMEIQIGHSNTSSTVPCVGTRPVFEVILEYARRFAISMGNKLFFGLFWSTSLTHDVNSYAHLGDRPLRRFLETLLEAHVLESSMVVLLSDHGQRSSAMRITYQGWMEERLPFLFFLFPRWFRERYPSALAAVRQNARRLTTPFDLHATLLDLLQPNSALNPDALRRRSLAITNTTRAISLFLPMDTNTVFRSMNYPGQSESYIMESCSLGFAETGLQSGGGMSKLHVLVPFKVPENRTCEDAGITPHWCTCLNSYPIPVDSDIAKRVANFLVWYINVLASRYTQCAQLSLAEILQARKNIPAKLQLQAKDTTVVDYVIVVRTVPGGALLEATVRHRILKDTLTIAGGLSRLNLYGSQSACVKHLHAKLFCYCRPA